MTGLWVDLAFWVFSIAAVWFGWRVFRTDSMVRATFALLASFLNVGAIMILMFAEYLGVATFFMMAVEMVVMAIFMVAFMMNPAGLNPMSMVHGERVAVAIGAVAATALAAVALFADLPDLALVDPELSIRDLGNELMGASTLVMEVVGVTLLASIIGVVILSSHRGRFGDAHAASLPPLMDPDDPTSRPGSHLGKSGGHAHHMGHDMGGMDHGAMDHDMGGTDHGAMDHGAIEHGDEHGGHA